MRIIELHIKNLNSLRLEKSIHFLKAPLGNTGLFAIVGDTGAGKSTILDAITLALYGRMPRNKNNAIEALSYGATEAHAKVVFETGDKRYLAEWSLRRAHGKIEGNIQSPRRKLSEFDPGIEEYRIIAEKIKEVDDAVAEVTGLDYDRFLRSVLLAQGEFAAFLKARVEARSELLESITGLEIYSQISQAAHLRHREEDQKLLELTRQKDQLKLLTREEKKELQDEQNQLDADLKTLKNTSDELRDLLGRMDQVAELQTEIEKLEEARKNLEEGRAALRESMQNLENHSKALPFKSDLYRLEHTAGQLEKNKQRILTLREQELPAWQDQAKALSDAILEDRETLQKRRAELPEKLLVLDEIRLWDNEIQRLDQSAVQQEKKLTAEEAEVTSLERDQQANKTAIDAREPQIRELKTWLEERTQLQSLAADWALLQRTTADWKEGKKTIDRLDRQLREKENLRQDQEKKNAAFHKELEQVRQNLAGQREKLTQLRPDLFAHSHAELVQLQTRELQDWKEKKEWLDRLEVLQTEYSQLLREHNEYADSLNSLQFKEFHLLEELLAVSDDLDEQRSDLEYKQGIYEQQLRIANYEKDRQKLKEGDPCPLCLSTHHPFHEHPVETAFVDKAGEEYQKCKTRVEKLQKQQNQFIRQLNELEVQKEMLIGSEQKRTLGLLNQQERKMEEQERKMLQLLNGFEERELLHATDFRKQRQQWYQEQFETHKRMWDQILKGAAGLAALEKRETALDREAQSHEFSLRELQKEVQLLTESLREQQTRTQKLETELAGWLQRYGFSRIDDDPQRQIDQLGKDLQDFQQKNTALTRLQEEQKQAMDLERAFSGRLEIRREVLQQTRSQLEETRQSQAELQGRRKEKLGDRDPGAERSRLQKEVEDLAARIAESDSLLAGIRSRIENLEEEAARLEKEAHSLEEDLRIQEQSLSEKLEKTGFSSLALAREALLPEETARQLETEVKAFQDRETEVRQALKTYAGQLKTALSKLPDDADRAATQERLHQVQARIDQHQVRFGELKNKLELSRKVEKESKSLEKDIRKQKAELARWQKLNDLIGSHNGQKFRTFAQGLTLERLVFLANQHLLQLNGRYQIRKTPGEALELEIVDTFQANNVRSMQTLSGGETFLVSLALALGLSDLAGQRSDIRSLFIDEGFGSLDEATLDLAISTLENLQSKGKTIGIISHVKELKERIATQIQVVKRSNGFSEVEVVG